MHAFTHELSFVIFYRVSEQCTSKLVRMHSLSRLLKALQYSEFNLRISVTALYGHCRSENKNAPQLHYHCEGYEFGIYQFNLA